MVITLEEFKRDVDLYIARSAIEEIHITDDGRTVAVLSDLDSAYLRRAKAEAARRAGERARKKGKEEEDQLSWF